MNKYANYLSQLFDYKRYWLFIGIALIFKVIIFAGAAQSNLHGTSNTIFVLKGDAIDYVAYCENFYQKGIHFIGDEQHKDYTYRMPTFDPLYLPLRCIFSQQKTLTLLIILQTILSAVSTYFIGLLAFRLFGKKIFFYLTFFVYCVSTYMAAYNSMLYTESLSASLLIISLYLLLIADERKRNGLFFLSGLLMAWVVFFRPFLVVLWAVTVAYIYFSNKKRATGIKVALTFAIAFVVADMAWTARNYVTTGRFVPLQDSLEWYKGEYKSLEWQVKLIKAFGFHWIWWDKKSEHTWFISDQSAKKLNVVRPDNSIFPSRTFNGDLNIDSLALARSYVLCAVDSLLPVNSRKACDAEGSRILQKFIVNLRTSRPFDYYFFNRMRIVYSFLNQPKGAPLKSIKYPLNVLAVLADAFINCTVIIAGLLGLLTLVIFNYKSPRLLYYVAFMPAFIVFLFCIVLASDEDRFLVMAYPFFTLGAVYLFVKIYEQGGRIFIPAFTGFFGFIFYLSYTTMIHSIHW